MPWCLTVEGRTRTTRQLLLEFCEVTVGGIDSLAGCSRIVEAAAVDGDVDGRGMCNLAVSSVGLRGDPDAMIDGQFETSREAFGRSWHSPRERFAVTDDLQRANWRLPRVPEKSFRVDAKCRTGLDVQRVRGCGPPQSEKASGPW